MNHDLLGPCHHTHYEGGPHCVHTAYQQGREDMLAKCIAALPHEDHCGQPEWQVPCICSTKSMITALCALLEKP